MSMLDRIIPTPDATVVDDVAEGMVYADRLEVAESEVVRLSESIADLELAHDDIGWARIDVAADREFSRDGLTRIARHSRLMVLANPLVRRAVALRTAYIWGDGVEIAARATGDSDENPTEQDVNAVVQAFLDDASTKKVLTGALAQQLNEKTLATDGMIFLALVTNPRLGAVQPRDIDADEIVELVRNPEDRTEVWFYKRRSTVAGKSTTRYYPDIAYRPGVRVAKVKMNDSGETHDVMWDSPVASLIVNPVNRWGWGVGDVYSALPWARAYKEGLEDWAKLVKALSRYAWRLTDTKKTKAQAAATKARQVATTSPDLVGGMAVGAGDQRLEAIPKSGATIDSQSFKPLAAMVASGTDVPVTMLLGDPGVTGARATAETLDRPTELMATMRRKVWADFLLQVLGYVIDSAVRAPAGGLQGSIVRDYLGRETITLAGDTERAVDVTWSDLTETPIDLLMDALEKADSIGGVPPVLMLRLILQALKVQDIDDVIDDATDDEGNLIDHEANAGQAAVDQFRNGQDPAEALR
jgi:hypothetical protein